MSDELDIDPELSALRNELLTSLTKKTSKPKPENELKTKSIEEDDELALLRLEALNAKRIKTQNELKKNNKIPGRFRYDQESEEEEEDNEELKPIKKNIDYEEEDPDANTNEYNPFTTAINPNQPNNKLPELCDYQFNYQTYRAECSKLMANDEYDPNSIHDKPVCLPEGFDLRNFLRDKAFKQQQTVNPPNDDSKTDDIVYERPITEPIDIKNELFYHKYKGKNYYDYNNRRKNYRLDKEDPYDRHDKYQLFKNNRTENDTKKCLDEQSNNEDESSDDDSNNNCKKLRSVVAVISNSDNYQPSKDVQIVKSNRNSYQNISSSTVSNNNFYKRK